MADAPASRTWRLLGPAAMLGAVAAAAFSLTDAIGTALRAPATTDYLSFAAGARVLASGSKCLYCNDQLRAAEIALMGRPPIDQTGFPNPYANPPVAAFVLRPLGGMPLRSGLMIFLVFAVVALGAAALLLIRCLPPHWPGWARLLLLTSSVLSLPAITAFRLAQWDAILLLALTGAAILLKDRPFVAGLLLSTLLIKPQLLWLVIPVLVVCRVWRLLAGLAVGAGLVLISSVAIIGPEQLAGWVSAVRSPLPSNPLYTVGLPGLVAGAAADARLAFMTAVALALGAALLVWKGRHLLRSDLMLALGLGVALSLVCSPHVYPDDLLLLALPLVAWARYAPTAALTTAVALSVGWLVDVHLATPLWTRHLETVAMGVLIVGITRSLQTLTPHRSAAAQAPPRHFSADAAA